MGVQKPLISENNYYFYHFSKLLLITIHFLSMAVFILKETIEATVEA